jgi:uncharacterized protein YoxC
MHQTLTFITLAIVAIVVLVLVVYLVLIIIALRRAGNYLEELASGLKQIAEDTRPLSSQLDTIHGAMGKISGGLHAVDHNLIQIARILKLVS